MTAGIQRDFAHGKADGGGKLVIGTVGVHVQRYELILQQLLLRGELYGIAPNPRVAHVNSPVRRDGPAIGLSGPLDVLEFALACAHIPLGACHRRGYLPGLLTVGLDVTSSLTEVSAKRLSGFPLPAAENVMHLLEVLPQLLQGVGASVRGLKHLLDRAEIPTLDVIGGQLPHS
ncbi:hypothetical protein CKJ65_18870 [Mycobacterium intracellulare]|nr:hypothetical protein CKJ65_18870 [Mycobacterium intracellulare]